MTSPLNMTWLANPRAPATWRSAGVAKYFPQPSALNAPRFHRQLPEYQMAPLKGLPRLAGSLGLGGIFVKDEAWRPGAGSFRGLGSAFAIYRHLVARLGSPTHFGYPELMLPWNRARLGRRIFATAGHGHRGLGLAWAARQLDCDSVVYVERGAPRANVEALERLGATVVAVDGSLADAERQATADAAVARWQFVSDMARPGYEEIPAWIMQGYGTVFFEAQQQLIALGVPRPTHLLVQAGTGSLAAAAAAFYQNLPGPDRPRLVVVEPDQAACLHTSMEAGDGRARPFAGPCATSMASLAYREPNPIAWEVLRDTADVFAKASDGVAETGMRVLALPLAGDPSVTASESGALTVGALMAVMERDELSPLRRHLGLGRDSQVLLVNTEQPALPDEFRRALWDGAARRRNEGAGAQPRATCRKEEP